ncbi:MAG: hypothetical protein GY847_28910 [Proteobacteria bacterium]|nr:hypothetical protein [Pseudomonadota bacterium]
MTVVLTKTGGPSYSALGTTYRFTAALDTSHAAGGEPIDLTDYLSTLENASCTLVDAAADALYVFEITGPGSGVALTSSNVLIVAAQSDTLEGALDEANTIDLTSVGALVIEVTGKKAIPTSWA